ncbi:MAG: hypothetical protein UHM85_04765 [Acutalibacteraceae bacterium]|nr:hypothetical protein [Acutalibacteraceae bacterium]
MKRTVALILSLVLLVLPLSPTVLAAEKNEIFDDGSYISIGFLDNVGDTEDTDSEDAVSGILALIKRIISKILEFFAGKKTENKTENKDRSIIRTKYITYYDKNGVMLWEVFLRGEFKYNGEKSECTSAEVYYVIEDPDWEMLEYKATKNGAQAKGEFKIRQFKLGVPLKAVEKTFTITCDKNGNVK